jgi:hypothetical protein
LSTFFATGEVDDSLFTHHPVNFKAKIGFPLMAKLIAAAIVLLTAIAVALVWFIIARQRKQRR